MLKNSGMRQSQWLEEILVDLRYAARSFRRNPVFVLAALGCLSLGIGANILIFSLVNSILLRSLPYPNADQLAMVRFTPPNQPDQKLGTNPGSYFFIRQHNSVFQSMGALRITGFSVATESGESGRQWIQGGWVSPGLTDTMAVRPTMGRWFAREDTAFNIVISYGLWQRMYGGSKDVLGKKLFLDTTPATIVGVMPRGYQTMNSDIDLWRLQPDENLANALRSPNRVFNLFARLKQGVTPERAQEELNALAGPLSEEFEMNRGWSIKLDTLRDAYVGHLRRPLLVFQGAVLILLLIACANVAGLMLAQASTRHKELAMRAALGSTRSRVVRQLLTESIVLSLAGGVLGIALGWAGLRALTVLAPSVLPGTGDVELNLPVFAFGALLTLGTAVIFGVIPALQMSRPDLMEVLRDSSRSATAGGAAHRLRAGFVVVQVALSLVLLVGAGLMARSLLRLNMVQIGLEPHGLVTFQVPFSRTLYRGAGSINTPTGGMMVEMSPRLNQLTEQVRDRLAALPGVESVTIATTPPLGAPARRLNFHRPDKNLSEAEQESWSAEWYPISSGYFQTLKIPVIRGREFAQEDSDTGRPVAIINATMAQRFFPKEDPIGKQFTSDLLFDQPREIVGIVGDVRQDRYQSVPQAQMYVPRAQLPPKMDMTMSFEILVATFVIRTNSDPASLVPAFRQAAADVDRNQAINNVVTVEQYASGQLQDLKHYAVLLSIFGGVSALLSFVGLFGIMAHAVSQRTNEIGIRVALGATSGSVLRLIVRQGFTLVAAGMVAGVLASTTLTQAIERFLWGVTPTDPLTFGLVLAAMGLVALLACYIPARKVLRIDPINALRWE
jgi:putative ABC transport system permease protein